MKLNAELSAFQAIAPHYLWMAEMPTGPLWIVAENSDEIRFAT